MRLSSSSSRSALLAAAVALTVASTAPRVEAQTSGDKAAAEALFDAGRSLMEAGKFADACPKFEASQRLDAGLGTLLYLAECYEKANRLASAWATFNEAESIAMGRGDQSRAQIARERYTKLAPRLSKLWIKVADGNDPATVVKRDGEPVPRESWGIALPTDAGDHTIQATAPGRKPWSSHVIVGGEGANVAVNIPVLETLPVVSAPPPAPPPPQPSPLPADDHAAGGSANYLRPTAFVLGGVGIAGIALGSFFGLKAKSKNHDSLADCDPGNPNLCDQRGVNLRNDALSSARLGTVFMVGGGIFLAGGIVLYLVAPSNKPGAGGEVHVGAGAGPGAGRLTVEGAF